MVKSLFHRQWRVLICLLVMFCFLLLAPDRTEETYWGSGYDNGENYLNRYDPSDAEVLFSGLEEDSEEISALITAIERFEKYDGEIPEAELDIMDTLVGDDSYMTYDMLIWREQMMNAPGQYTDTIIADSILLRRLSRSLYNQKNFEEIIENQREIMRRGIRRGGSEVKKYEKILENLGQIEMDFPVADTLRAVNLLNYLEMDWHILALLAVMCFAFFSTGNQQKVTNQILISKFGMRRFAWAQIASAMLIAGACMVLYYIGIVLIKSEWRLSTIPWNHPLQVIVGYENILQDFTVLEYVLINIGLKMLVCTVFVSMVLLISSLSPNNIVSFAGTFLLFGMVYLARKEPQSAALTMGNFRSLFEELCYTDVGGYLIPHATICAAALFLLIPIILVVITFHYETSARKWVK